MSYDEAKFALVIDGILRTSDLNTISAKRIRKTLQNTLGYDISQHTQAINELIEARFDKIHEEVNEINAAQSSSPTTGALSSQAGHVANDSDMSDVLDQPKPKRRKVEKFERYEKAEHEDDAAFAARLQAELNKGARTTRGGGATKKAPRKNKAKSAARVKENGEAGSGSDAEPVKRTGGFHKPMALSDPLAELLGETQLSRPQTVKKIWEYVKARDLQDPSDRRQIRCDDAMRAVFKVDSVHMFTMNKILNQNLYPVEVTTPVEAAPPSEIATPATVASPVKSASLADGVKHAPSEIGIQEPGCILYAPPEDDSDL